jgi:tRNA pseudouridine38-40 synthase
LKYFLEISYKGTAYHGWQIQNNAHSVQQELNECLGKILGEPIMVQGSGRTDTGVHCLQQFAHFETTKNIVELAFIKSINAILPKDISVQNVRQVTAESHARFSATSRAYIYKITQKKDPFLTEYAFFYHQPLDIAKMQQASKLLLNWQDYTAFSKTNSNNTHNLCDIKEAYWEQQNQLLFFNIKANRFLRGMVRLLTGALLQVGSQKINLQDFETILYSKKIVGKRYAVPANGLYLRAVEYPNNIFDDDNN